MRPGRAATCARAKGAVGARTCLPERTCQIRKQAPKGACFLSRDPEGSGECLHHCGQNGQEQQRNNNATGRAGRSFFDNDFRLDNRLGHSTSLRGGSGHRGGESSGSCDRSLFHVVPSLYVSRIWHTRTLAAPPWAVKHRLCLLGRESSLLWPSCVTIAPIRSVFTIFAVFFSDSNVDSLPWRRIPPRFRRFPVPRRRVGRLASR